MYELLHSLIHEHVPQFCDTINDVGKAFKPREQVPVGSGIQRHVRYAQIAELLYVALKEVA